MPKSIEFMEEGLNLELPDHSTQELIRKLWRAVPPTLRHQVSYEILSLAESVRLQEVLYPEVVDGVIEPYHWIKMAHYTNENFRKYAIQAGEDLDSELETGWRNDQISPLEQSRSARETDLMIIIEDRFKRRQALLSQPSSLTDSE
ncbi:MAG: hypothetical protein WCV81_05420 [Microgenomates group bacterium]|jgi:hypothetical protein